MYYKTKLIVYNFTLFNLQTQDGYCFLWHKVEGGLSSNEFSSLLVHFLDNNVISFLPKIKKRLYYTVMVALDKIEIPI